MSRPYGFHSLPYATQMSIRRSESAERNARGRAARAASEVDQLRSALEKAQSAILDHHEWHKCQTTPDPEHGYIPADEYAESGLCEKTLSVLAGIRAALESK